MAQVVDTLRSKIDLNCILDLNAYDSRCIYVCVEVQ